MLPAMLCREMLDVANEPTSVRVEGGQTRQVTLFEAKVLELASGRTRDRLACRNFIEKVKGAAARQQTLGKSEPAPLETWVPRDLSDEEFLERERTQALLEQLWRSNPRVAEMSDKELMEALTNLKRRSDAGNDRLEGR